MFFDVVDLSQDNLKQMYVICAELKTSAMSFEKVSMPFVH